MNRLIVASLALGLVSACTHQDTRDSSSLLVAHESAAHGADNLTLFSGPPMPPPNEFRTARGAPGPAYWQQRVDYSIDATLDGAARQVSASGTMVYTNNSPQDLGTIWVSLDQNLFRPDSNGARISTPSGRFGNRDGFAGGFENLAARIDGREVTVLVQDTIGRIDLPSPVSAAGGRVSIEFSWSFAIPPYGSDRMGIDEVGDGPIFQIAQWFPSACVFDDVHGWNTLPYLGQGEFYSNFGTYDVRITVPADHLVAATGELVNGGEVLTSLEQERLSRARASEETVVIRAADEPRPGGGAETRTWRFSADNVRTFAWASSRSFAWDACFIPGCGRGSDGEPGRGEGTLCQSFYPKEAAALWSAAGPGGGSTQMLRASLAHYGERWYAYPYPTATNVNGIVGGMEYPMLAFSSGRDPAGERGLWGVTTHEIGHTWFPMVINTDERRHAWMDEGFNSFINYYATLERYPDDLPRRGNPRRWARDHRRPTTQPIDIPADAVEPGTLGDQQYGKTATGLTLLREGILGPERFDRAFRAYLRRWAFKSPRPWDFFRAMEDESGEALGWFWRGWFYERGVLDQAVTTVMQPGGAAGNAEATDARVTIRNLGQLVMPVVFKVEYNDGSDEVRRLPVTIWQTGNSWQTQWDTRDGSGRIRKVRRIELDPNEDFPDVNLSNNTWKG